MEKTDGLMDVREAAAYLGIAVGTLYRLAGKAIPVVRLSVRCIRFRKSKLDEFIERHSYPNAKGVVNATD